MQDLPCEDPLTTSRDGFIAIYVLEDPRDNTFRYVGKANDTHVRLYGHWIYARRGEPTPVYRDWMTELVASSYMPLLSVLDWVRESQWQEAERAWIAYGRELGWPLLNVMPGGASAPSGDLHWSRREPERWQAAQRATWDRIKAEGYSEAFLESRRAGGRAAKGRKRPGAVTWATCECGYTMHRTRVAYHAQSKGHEIESFWCWTDPAKRLAKYRVDTE